MQRTDFEDDSVRAPTNTHEKKIASLIEREAKFDANFLIAKPLDGRCKILYDRYKSLYGYILFEIPAESKPYSEKGLENDELLVRQMRDNYKSAMRPLNDWLRTVAEELSLFKGVFQINDVLISDNKKYNFDDCPLEYLYRIFNTKKFISILRMLSEVDKKKYIELIHAQIEFHTEKTKLLKCNLEWTVANPDKVGKVANAKAALNSALKRTNSIIKYLNEQKWLMQGEFHSKGEVFDLNTCPEEILLKIFHERHIIRQFQLIWGTPHFEAYLVFLTELTETGKYLIKPLESMDLFLFEIECRIQDIHRQDQLIEKLRPAATLIVANIEESNTQARERLESYYEMVQQHASTNEDNSSSLLGSNRNIIWNEMNINAEASNDSKLSFFPRNV